MERDEWLKHIGKFLLKRKWVKDIDRIEFLAAGEYNENYFVKADGKGYVFRINHGSQLNLTNQIEYEYRVLRNLENSGVTPKPFFYELSPESPGDGVLLMEYIPGITLDYRKDYDKAARVFASVHRQPYSNDLIVQHQPVYAIAEESLGLLKRFSDHPLQGIQARLLKYHEEVLDIGRKTEEAFKNEPLCIVNTEVNSKNFIIRGDKGFLIDWEKAVVSQRYQDLGHFLVPTTTLWKSDYTFDSDSRLRFLSIYASMLGLERSIEELSYKTKILEKTILLRAMSWCFMAYYEYTQQERTLKDEATFNRIQMYLREVECFLS